jgi:hypothetical protein
MWPSSRGGTTPTPLGCPAATGRLARRSLGPVTLGMSRARARRAFAQSSRRGRQNMDFFCLTPNGIRVAYPSRAVLKSLSPRAQRGVRGRVVLALTAAPNYSLRGVHPGTRLSKVAVRLGARRGVRIGRNTWYLVSAGPSRGVLKVSRGVIEEIGIADRSLTATLGAARRLLANLT